MRLGILKSIACVILLCVGIASAIPAQAAKRTFNSKNEQLYIVEKDGVTATLYDCRKSTEVDQSGKVKLRNNNDYPVVVQYQIYGIDKNKKKTLVDTGQQELAAKEAPKWGWTFSYRDFKKNGEYQKYVQYAMAVKVKKAKGATTSTTQTSADKVYNNLYNKVSQGKTLSSTDYDNAIKLLKGYSTTLISVAKSARDMSDAQLEALEKKYESHASRIEWLYGILINAGSAGKLSQKQYNEVIKILQDLQGIEDDARG